LKIVDNENANVEEENILVEPEPPDNNQQPNPINSLEHHLSFNALRGSSIVGTMWFKGSINGTIIQVLLDSGSFDNFLQPQLASYLKLPIEPVLNFHVLVGNEHYLIV